MKKFTKIIKESENEKVFTIDAHVQLTIKASSEGEAAYIADSTLSALKNQSEYTINKIEETSGIIEHMELYPGKQGDNKDNVTPEEQIEKAWEAEFGDRTPSSTEKLEFYHDLRKMGFDGILIQKVLKNKLLGE